MSSDDDFDDGYGSEYEYVDDGYDSEFELKRKRGAKKKKSGSQKRQGGTETTPERPLRDFSSLTLKRDHARRPLWVTPDCRIYLEAFSPLYTKTTDFLIAIAEPKARPEFLHEYEITEGSLYAAVAVSIDDQSILTVLSRLSKNELPREVKTFVKEHAQRFGRAKLVLRQNRFFVESERPEVLDKLKSYRAIVEAIDTDPRVASGAGEALKEREENLSYKTLGLDLEDDKDADMDGGGERSTYSFCVKDGRGYIEAVRKTSREQGYPLMEEYDFNGDQTNADLDANLRATARPRDYQERALSKMFGNGRARSGIIVLPCGAGKTLTGISAACTVHKSVIVLCNSAVSAGQWQAEFLKWSNIDEKRVLLYTREAVDRRKRVEDADIPDGAVVVISTYSMMSFSQKRSEMSARLMEQIENREWGLMILDEVHQAPAESFRRVMENVKTHAKLGLTATLVREDGKIDDLHYLIGPKLYEANWMDLTSRGFLSNVECIEVWCAMTKEFYREYLRRSALSGDRHFYALNPNKFRVCEYLMHYHEGRGDKILVFCDDIISLEIYADRLLRPWIAGSTPLTERQDILESFRSNSSVKTVFISRVGDTSIDLPMANVLIQVNFHGTSRRQEAQRLGRILRPKPNSPKGSFAFFYTLVSTDTCEMYHSAGRQQYLVDQGYTYKVVTDLVEHAHAQQLAEPKRFPTVLKTRDQEVELIVDIQKELEKRAQAAAERVNNASKRKRKAGDDVVSLIGSGVRVRRQARNMGELSGVSDIQYMTYDADA